MNFEWFVGLRYLKAKQKQAFISLISVISVAGVAVGVMALIIVLAVMTGFSEGLRDKILGINSHIVVQKAGETIAGYEDLMEHLAQVPGVTGITPYLYSQTMISAGEGGSGAVLRAIDPKTISSVLALEGYMVSGSLRLLASPEAAKRSATPGIVLGKDLARQLGVNLHDRVRLILASGPLTPMGVIPKMKTCVVVGIFDTGMFEYDNALAYVSLATAQDFFDLGDVVHGLELRVNDIYQAGDIARDIEKRLGLSFIAKDWIRTNKNLFSALKLEKTALSIIVALIVLVAAFNIVSTLTMMVMEKTKDIAIMKSMGATSGNIMRIFIYDGLIIGFAGTAIGIAGGLFVCELLSRYKFIKIPDVYPMSTLPIKVEPFDVILIASSAVVITLLATLYPSWQAAKVDPAVTLRYE